MRRPLPGRYVCSLHYRTPSIVSGSTAPGMDIAYPRCQACKAARCPAYNATAAAEPLTVICTCSHEHVLAYPATVVVEYLLPILASPQGVRRVSEGVRLVGKEMIANVHRVKCNVRVNELSLLSDSRLVWVAL